MAHTYLYERNTNVKCFQNNKVLLLHCFTDGVVNVPMANCDALSVKFRISHMSIPKEAGVWRLILMPDRGTEVYFRTPKIIKVKTSCEVCVNDQEFIAFTYF